MGRDVRFYEQIARLRQCDWSREAPTRRRGEEMGRTPRQLPMKEDYETTQKKQAAADVLTHYSQFAMACIGEGVRPVDLRLHLMKEISGMPTALKKESVPVAASPDSTGEPSSSGSSKGERN